MEKDSQLMSEEVENQAQVMADKLQKGVGAIIVVASVALIALGWVLDLPMLAAVALSVIGIGSIAHVVASLSSHRNDTHPDFI